MSKKRLTKEEIKEIVKLRQTGHSLPEIKKITKKAYSTVWGYIQGIEVLPNYSDVLRNKQGGSKARSDRKWREAQNEIINIIGKVTRRDILIFLAGIYWGEGTKKELNLINGDPYLIRSFLLGLDVIGVKKDQIRFNFRVFSGMDELKIINFWVKFLDLNSKQIGKSEIVKGNGSSKLQYGMCRVRVVKSSFYFKRVMSMIDLIKSNEMPL